ncbi:MAG: DegT/DnrJ/EryC1/StrS family aminotransferase [Cyclobacteriaceae bacterium]
MSKERIYLSPPHMSGREMEYVKEAFELNWVAPAGPHIDRFEKRLSEYVGVPHCVALSSGTAAIHLALIELGVSQGDEVLCSTFTFIGSCNPILYAGATPVFIDSEEDTWNMDPQLLREGIIDRTRKGKRPKAIIVVHLYGNPARIRDIMSIAREFDIPVIEDAAEALGSEYEGKKLGSFGDIGIFSFNGNKIITTSGGGAMVSHNRGWIDHARFLSTQARDPAPHYEHSQIGYNYRLSNVSAAIGLGQLEVIDDRVAQRRTIFDKYRHELANMPGLSFQQELRSAKSNRWLTTILLRSLEEREKVRLALEAENIESRPLWKPMHLQSVCKNAPVYEQGASARCFEVGLCLPSGSGLLKAELAIVSQLIKQNIYKLL